MNFLVTRVTVAALVAADCNCCQLAGSRISKRATVHNSHNIMRAVPVKSFFILLSIGATCYLLWALGGPTQVKSSLPKPPHQTLLEPIHDYVATTSSDLRALLALPTEAGPQPNETTTTQCGQHIFHRKPIMLGHSIGVHQQVVIESRKALFCFIGRIGSSRWKRLALKASEEIDPCSKIPKDKFKKMLANDKLKPRPFLLLFSSLTTIFLSGPLTLRYMANISPVKRRQIMMDDCYFRFVFLRDPFSRLLSAWHALR